MSLETRWPKAFSFLKRRHTMIKVQRTVYEKITNSDGKCKAEFFL